MDRNQQDPDQEQNLGNLDRNGHPGKIQGSGNHTDHSFPWNAHVSRIVLWSMAGVLAASISRP
jgi:hypothetical protein